MKRNITKVAGTLLALIILLPFADLKAADIERPEEIKSKRLVVYDIDTYKKLAEKWKAYNEAYPSEYAYANWMYAARYAGDNNYSDLMHAGLNKYPSNPTLLYLRGIEHLGGQDIMEERKFLEKSIALDPSSTDPWFAIVGNYMNGGEDEKVDVALRKILESGIITDEVMDYCYNMMAGMDKNGVLITNGDNDTYPVWIMQRILNIRPDISIINRSLLNTDWYPIYVIEHGAPSFITKAELDNLREAIIKRMKAGDVGISAPGPFSDTLIFKIIESADKAGRPVYFSNTLYRTGRVKDLADKGRDLGLINLVTSPRTSYANQLRGVYGAWLNDFRTAGLDSWRLRFSSEGDAGRQLITNYASALKDNLDSLKIYAPDLRTGLFHWYLDHLDKTLNDEHRTYMRKVWCAQSDIKEIKDWCKQKGIE